MEGGNEILTLGLEDPAKEELREAFSQYRMKEAPATLATVMSPPVDRPLMVVCGPRFSDVSVEEVAQSLRLCFRLQPIYYLASTKKAYDRKGLLKNGFTDAMLLNMDLRSFKRIMMNGMINAGGEGTPYRRVSLNDLASNEPFEFDIFIYLPANQRFMLFHRKGIAWDSEKRLKLASQGVNTIFVKADEYGLFEGFVQRRNVDPNSSTYLTTTEGIDRYFNEVRALLAATLNLTARDVTIGNGADLLAGAQKIVDTYVFGEQPGSWMERTLALVDQWIDSVYSHDALVGCFSAFFAQALDLPIPSDLALAGLFHDIGMADVSLSIQRKNPATWTEAERAEYESHVRSSLKILEMRKLPFGTRVMKTIEDHHEFFGQGGFPRNLGAGRVSTEAQVLAIADDFAELTATSEGKVRIQPKEAMELIARNEQKKYDPKLVSDLTKAFGNI